jgi:hypothetical protein
MPLRHVYTQAYRGTVPLVPSDSSANDATLPVTRAVMISGGSGDVTFMFADGQLRTIGGLVVGEIYPFAIVRIAIAGTTALTPFIGFV